jgi:uncharacterized membrane protein YedE/YeeE
MQIDWVAFTPVPALLGGMLLGISAAIYMLLHGRILGISGIIAGLLNPQRGDWGWRLSLLLGILSAPLFAAFFMDFHPTQIIDTNWTGIVVAGLLVGFGAQYGSGCTSGHGICGLSRLSPRSLMATVMFMFSGFLTASFVRHALGFAL